ncbi:MAG: Ig-like domain-containing protein [Bacilli bacterium]|nr:Ig-like domain-containing protein [Bacilli bacterium]
MVVFDVELRYKNANPVRAGLKAWRNPTQPSNSIYALASKYDDKTSHLHGYQIINDVVQRNALNASDFYTFYSVFTKNPFSTPEQMWTAMHQKTDEEDAEGALFSKFSTGGSYDDSVSCRLCLKDKTGADVDSLVIPGNDPDVGSVYHCYVGIDYDYEHTAFFLNENRLGKTYLLDRDFGFYFMGTQLLGQIITATSGANTLATGETLALSTNAVGTVTWSSNDETVATVNSGGVVTGVSEGSAVITAKCEGYLDAHYVLTVADGE